MKWRWPLIVVTSTSFALGILFGYQQIKQQKEELGQVEIKNQLKILAPAGLVPIELIKDFARREKIQIVLHEESNPPRLLRRLSKSAPSEFDAAFLFHHQIQMAKVDRKLTNLFDSRFRFPSVISPDFRILPDDRNLMESAPLFWGLIGLATPEKPTSTDKFTIGFWPGFAVAATTNEASLFETLNPWKLSMDLFINQRDWQVSFFRKEFDEPMVMPTLLSHPQFLHFKKTQEQQVNFSPLNSGKYALWVLSLAAIQDGQTDVVQRFAKYLFEPEVTSQLLSLIPFAASTLKSIESTSLQPELKPSYFRKFSMQEVSVAKDDRVRELDEMIEKTLGGVPLISKKETETQNAKSHRSRAGVTQDLTASSRISKRPSHAEATEEATEQSSGD